jgi:ubiquinone/menaquinone biosynthesis C-methylase UbiE
MLVELSKRLNLSRMDFKALQKEGVSFHNYLEIGAEYGVRAALLESEFNGHGFALDIAAGPLKSTPFFARKLHLKKIPKRIVADAYHLPFKTATFSFIFCYQTLHHFPDPTPIINEMYRVLQPGGHFFFAEEPIKQDINLRLFRRPTKINGILKYLRYILILPFISQIGKTEVEYGILETAFPISTWQKAVRIFTDGKATITPYPFTRTETFSKNGREKFVRPSLLTHALIKICGGGISMLLRKPGIPSRINQKDTLYCPVCKVALKPNFSCLKCKTQYSYKSGIITLLSATAYQSLYGAKE